MCEEHSEYHDHLNWSEQVDTLGQPAIVIMNNILLLTKCEVHMAKYLDHSFDVRIE